MTTETFVPGHTERVARLVSGLCTRTLLQFAEESRLDGESLKEAVERYEIDYAWQVLGSGRMRDATVRALETRLQQPASSEQRAQAVKMLRDAAAAQAPDLLMSHDNDVPEQLAQLLGAAGDELPSLQAAAAAG